MEVESTIKEHEMLFKPLVSHVPEEDDDHDTLAPITSGEIKAYLKKCKSSWTVSDTVYLNRQMTRFMRPWSKSVMLVWLQDTMLSYGKRLKVS